MPVQTNSSSAPSYQPPAKVIDKYAQVLVNFALNSGQGLKPGEVVECVVPDVAKAMALALQNQILQAGGHPIIKLAPTGFDRHYYNLANFEQLKFFPEKYLKAKSELLDHQIGIIAEPYPNALKKTDPKKIITARDVKKPYKDWLMAKENQGAFTWSLALWGVPAKAELVDLSLEDYWQQIIQACFLDETDPIAKWQEVFQLQQEIKQKLNDLKIEQILMKGPDVDLKIKLGANRVWKGGSGRNIPSFEIFTSPDWRQTTGWIRVNQPVYRYGNVIQDVYFEFKNGQLVNVQAKQGNKFLQEMVKSKNADKLGEFSLTDKRMSRITQPMAETLFDENIGGPFGNTHVALGMAYKDCYRGQAAKLSKQDWEKLGFNDAAEHTDFVSTQDRTVTAVLADGQEKVIYHEGQFVL